MATAKKTAAPKTKTATAAAFPAKASPVKAVKPTKAPKAKPPAVVAKAADPKGVPGSKPAKRTVAVPENGLAGVPQHKTHDVASLAHILGTFPRGATFEYMDNRLDVYNLRGRLIAEVRKGDKPAKTARADKL